MPTKRKTGMGWLGQRWGMPQGTAAMLARLQARLQAANTHFLPQKLFGKQSAGSFGRPESPIHDFQHEQRWLHRQRRQRAWTFDQ